MLGYDGREREPRGALVTTAVLEEGGSGGARRRRFTGGMGVCRGGRGEACMGDGRRTTSVAEVKGCATE